MNESITYSLVENLKNQNIILRDAKDEMMSYVGEYTDNKLSKKIMASRHNDMEDIDLYYNTKLDDILNLDFLGKMKDVKVSSECILKHMENDDKILLLVDFDVDGVTSGALGKLMFNNVLEYDNVEVIVNKKTNGYGINDKLVDEAIELHKSFDFKLIITADHGSNNRDGINRLINSLNIDVIVTDHHLIEPSKSPQNVVGFVNPQRDDCDMSNKISGATVLYFLLTYAFLYKNRNKVIPNDTLNTLYYYLTYVGMTIISDMMDMRNYINRKIVIKALAILNSKRIKHNPFWTTVMHHIGNSYFVDETTLSFNLNPKLNTPGRIKNPRLSYETMVANTEGECEMFFQELDALNDKRKDMQVKAVKAKAELEYKNELLYIGLSKEANNIQGILANKKMFDDKFRAAIIFAPTKDKNIIAGSGRLNDEHANLKEMIDIISKDVNYIINHGGHAGAIGIQIRQDENNLEDLFNRLSKEMDKTDIVKDEIYFVDEIIYSNKKLITSLYDVKECGPYGHNYPKPTFVSDFVIKSFRVFKKPNGTYLSMDVKLSVNSNFSVNAFYTLKAFEQDEILNNLYEGKNIRLIYTIDINTFKDINKTSLNVIKVIIL